MSKVDISKFDDQLVENNERFCKVHEEFKQDFFLADANLGDKSKMVAGLKAKWVEMWIRHRRQLAILREYRKELKEEYVREHGREDIPKIKTEREAESVELIKKVDLQILQMADVVDYLYEVKDVAHKFGFDVGHSIDVVKLESR